MFVVIEVDLGLLGVVDVFEVLKGRLFHREVVVLENLVDVVGVAVLGALEEAVCEVVFGLPECGSFDVWRKPVGETESVDILEIGKLSVVLVVAMETIFCVLGEEGRLRVVNEVEGIGSSDGHLFVDMETVLENPGADMGVEDSGPAVLEDSVI